RRDVCSFISQTPPGLACKPEFSGRYLGKCISCPKTPAPSGTPLIRARAPALALGLGLARHQPPFGGLAGLAESGDDQTTLFASVHESPAVLMLFSTSLIMAIKRTTQFKGRLDIFRDFFYHIKRYGKTTKRQSVADEHPPADNADSRSAGVN